MQNASQIGQHCYQAPIVIVQGNVEYVMKCCKVTVGWIITCFIIFLVALLTLLVVSPYETLSSLVVVTSQQEIAGNRFVERINNLAKVVVIILVKLWPRGHKQVDYETDNTTNPSSRPPL